MGKLWNRAGYYTGKLDFYGDVPWEYQKTKRVRSITQTEDRPAGLCRELASALVRDFALYPSLRMLCAAYQVDYEAVVGWVLNGTSGEGTELEAWFSACLAAAEADAAKELYQKFLDSAVLGSKSTCDYYKLLTGRWLHLTDDPDISTLLQKKGNKGNRLKALLRNPPPGLVSDLNAAGWTRAK